jgi:hypothetical protein
VSLSALYGVKAVRETGDAAGAAAAGADDAADAKAAVGRTKTTTTTVSEDTGVDEPPYALSQAELDKIKATPTKPVDEDRVSREEALFEATGTREARNRAALDDMIRRRAGDSFSWEKKPRDLGMSESITPLRGALASDWGENIEVSPAAYSSGVYATEKKEMGGMFPAKGPLSPKAREERRQKLIAERKDLKDEGVKTETHIKEVEAALEERRRLLRERGASPDVVGRQTRPLVATTPGEQKAERVQGAHINTLAQELARLQELRANQRSRAKTLKLATEVTLKPEDEPPYVLSQTELDKINEG